MNRIEQEKHTVRLMIELYCKKKHRTQELCKDCASLLNYSNERTDRCPFQENKTFCSNCTVHCYKPEMRNRIKDVMRYSGPLMLFYHPITAIKHLAETKLKQKK